MITTIGWWAQATPWHSQRDVVDMSSETCTNQIWSPWIPRLNCWAKRSRHRDPLEGMGAGEPQITQKLTPRSQARCRCREIARPEPSLGHQSLVAPAAERPVMKTFPPGTQRGRARGCQASVSSTD